MSFVTDLLEEVVEALPGLSGTNKKEYREAVADFKAMLRRLDPEHVPDDPEPEPSPVPGAEHAAQLDVQQQRIRDLEQQLADAQKAAAGPPA